MGDLIRQYWVPAMLSGELAEADCPPVRLRLLGENLVAFRDSSGAVGLVAENCPHRGASLFFGRNEEEGLRCVYHGWKFDATARASTCPLSRREQLQAQGPGHRLPLRERGGLVWAYMGPRADAAAAARARGQHAARGPVLDVGGHARVQLVQAFEGDIDTCHLGFLHQGSYDPSEATPGSFSYYGLAERAPKYSVVETAYGTMYGAYRTATRTRTTGGSLSSCFRSGRCRPRTSWA